jgi:hypothetical protein
MVPPIWRSERDSNWRYARSVRGEWVALPNKKKPFFEPLCRPTLPITLSGVDVRRFPKKHRLKNRFSRRFSNGENR